MFRFNMQLFHKPTAYMRAYRAKKKAEGSEKNTSSTYVSGGKVATVEYSSYNGSRVEKIRTFADNDGFVKDLEVFATSYLVPNKYDVVVPLYVATARSETPYLGSNKEATALGKKTGKVEMAHIGINVNTPKGVSEKQEAYAKKVATQMIRRSAERFVQGVALGQTTLENMGEVFKKQPALSARQVLDGRFRW